MPASGHCGRVESALAARENAACERPSVMNDKDFGLNPTNLIRTEAKQACRIVNEDAMPERLIWRDHGQEIQ